MVAKPLLNAWTIALGFILLVCFGTPWIYISIDKSSKAACAVQDVENFLEVQRLLFPPGKMLTSASSALQLRFCEQGDEAITVYSTGGQQLYAVKGKLTHRGHGVYNVTHTPGRIVPNGVGCQGIHSGNASFVATGRTDVDLVFADPHRVLQVHSSPEEMPEINEPEYIYDACARTFHSPRLGLTEWTLS